MSTTGVVDINCMYVALMWKLRSPTQPRPQFGAREAEARELRLTCLLDHTCITVRNLDSLIISDTYASILVRFLQIRL